MPYEEPAQPPEAAPKPLALTRTAQLSAGQMIIPALAFLIARHYACDIETAAMLAAGLYAAIQGLAQIAMRRAIGGWLLVASLTLPGCCSHREGLAAADQGLAVIRADYDGTAPTPPTPEEAKAKAQRRLELVDQIRATLRAMR